MKKILIAATAALLFLNNQNGTAKSTTDDQLVPPTPPIQSTSSAAAIAIAQRAALARKLALSGGVSSPLTQPLDSPDSLELIITGGGIPFTNKIVLDPYVTYGVAPVVNWQTDDEPSEGFYGWTTLQRTLVTNNGPAIQSAQFMAPANSQSYAYGILTNYHDAYGDSMSGTLTAWYQAYASQAANGQYFRCNIGGVQGSPGPGNSTNLPMTSVVWKRFTLFTSPFGTNSTENVYFTQFKGTINNGETPDGYVDNSVHWQPYEPDYIGLKFSLNTSTWDMTLYWDAYYQLTNHWHLMYTTDPAGPWNTNTFPVVFSNNIASVTFSNSPPMFYKLAHY
jgi:hypothetical protein